MVNVVSPQVAVVVVPVRRHRHPSVRTDADCNRQELETRIQIDIQLVSVDIYRCGELLYCGCCVEIATMGIGWCTVNHFLLSNDERFNIGSLSGKDQQRNYSWLG